MASWCENPSCIELAESYIGRVYFLDMGKRKTRKKTQKKVETNSTNSNDFMSPAKTITIDREDGSQEIINVQPVVGSDTKEVDLVHQDGSTQVFVPKE